MKKQSPFFLLVVLLLSGTVFSQSLSRDVFFYPVTVGPGEAIPMHELYSSIKPPIPTNSLSAGYFDLYLVPGSLFAQNSAAANVLQEVYKNISGLINSPLAATGNTVRINVLCDDIPITVPLSVLGQGGLFFDWAYNSLNPNPGLIDSQTQKVLLSGQDANANLPTSVFPAATNFYSSVIYLNPNPPGLNWNFNLSTTSIGPGYVDCYSVLLHEVMHTLGFNSLIGASGVSLMGPVNNYFSRYDQYLTNSAGTPLIAGPSTACATSSLTFQGSPSSINSNTCIGANSDLTNCSNAVKYVSSNVNVKVYTPACFEPGSSLSHFEDMCSYGTFTSSCIPTPTAPGYNNLYFLMSNSTNQGNCYVKRHFTEEERYVLCDLGYSVNTTYTSNAAGASYTYAGSACNPPAIWGMHDGFSGSVFTYTTSTSTFSVLISSVLANDAPAATQISCVEVVYGNATLSFPGSSLSVTSTGGSGLVMLRYLPKTAGGLVGTETYIFVYFVPQNCTPNVCNMISNGGFESVSSTIQCGMVGLGPIDVIIDCWDKDCGSPDVFKRTCTSPYSNGCDLGTDCWGFAIDSHNGTPNDRIVGIEGTETIKNCLGAPLVPGQTYQLSLWLYNMTANPIVSAFTFGSIVVDVWADLNVLNVYGCSTPTLPVIGEFTVNPNVWTQFTNTFVFAPANSVNHNVVMIGTNTVTTGLFNSGNLGYCFIDDVSLVPITSPGPVFSIPQAANCGNTTFSNLAQYVNMPGTFSGIGVSSVGTGTNTVYNFNSPTIGTLSPGTYPVIFTYTNGVCINSISQNIILQSPSFTLTTNGYPVYCTNQTQPIPPVTLNATSTPSSGITYVWQPGNLSGATVTTAPLNSQSYTVFAFGNCQISSTLAVTVSSNCCSSTVTALSPSILSTYSISNSAAINADISIPPGQTLSFINGEFVFAPGVKIVVNSGAAISIKDSHLYSCSADLWQGIVVKDGGSAQLSYEDYDNLIEDAVTAIDASSQLTNTLSSIISAERTTFNKNYIDIKITDYVRNSSTYPFIVNGCVFSCRDFTFTSSAWPTTTTTSTGLRYASGTTTTGLSAPYLMQGTSVANLKNPYSAQSSQTGIQLNNVGFSNSTCYGVHLGNMSSVPDFNVFDNHQECISALNSNMSSYNNVFQNAKYGIRHNVTSVLNADLDMDCSDINVGNRFWDCYAGVFATNTWSLIIENALFRSTQTTTLSDIIIGGPGGPSSTSANQFLPGSYGVLSTTNRFTHLMRYNEFTNLNTAIKYNVAPGTYTAGSSTVQNGIYAYMLAAVSNTISPLLPTATSTVIGNNFINRAIDITAANSFSWSVATSTYNPWYVGLQIKDNKISRVFQGINLSGTYGTFNTNIESNVITLEDDNLYNAAQRAISVSNTLGNTAVVSNVVTGTGLTNTQATLVCCTANTGVSSPSVTCNTIKDAYVGFEFTGSNSNADWEGNFMQSLGMGLLLCNYGVMGQQGINAASAANIWDNSSWWTSTGNSATYVLTSSDANLSPMWIKSGTSTPPTNNGSAIPQLQYSSANSNLIPASGGDYDCISISNNKPIPLPDVRNYNSDEGFYIAATAIYRFLQTNDSVRGSDRAYSDFCDGFSGSSIDLFWQVEADIYGGAYDTTPSLNSAVSPTNAVESNYQAFYGLQLNYLLNGYLSDTDSASLFALTQLCPGTDGTCVDQARALYDNICGNIQRYPDGCEGGLRQSSLKKNGNQEAWKINIYPNPTNSFINIASTIDNEFIKIAIMDVTGRKMLEQEIKIKDFLATLDLGLVNGVYLVTITNSMHESLNSKIIISK